MGAIVVSIFVLVIAVAAVTYFYCKDKKAHK